MTTGDWINLTIAVLTFIVVCISLRAIYFSSKSLKIAIQTRSDQFLPMIISNKYFSSSFKKNADFDIYFYLTNSGHGLALHPEVILIDENGDKIAQAKKFDQDKQKDIIIDSLDYRIETGSYQYVFRFKEDDFNKLSNRTKLTIEYFDVFNRKILSIYDLILNEDKEGKCEFKLGRCTIIFPK